MARSAFVLVVLLSAVGAAVSTFAVMQHKSTRDLPYNQVPYDVRDARRAFSSQGIALLLRSHAPAMTDLSDARAIVEVTVFGPPERVRAAGFHDLQHGRDCTVAGHLASHWRGNVRAILNCDLVRDDHAWITRMNRALMALP